MINRCRSALVARREWATDPDDLQLLHEAHVHVAGGSDTGLDLRLDLRADCQALDRAMKALPMRQRMAVAMWAFADQPVAEIATWLELDANATHQLLNRARRSLRAHLEGGVR